MRSVLERFRVVFIMLLLAIVIQAILLVICHLLGLSVSLHGDIPAVFAILIIIFILYRNKFQFHGFYNGKRREKLPRRLTLILSAAALLCLVIAPFIK